MVCVSAPVTVGDECVSVVAARAGSVSSQEDSGYREEDAHHDVSLAE